MTAMPVQPSVSIPDYWQNPNPVPVVPGNWWMWPQAPIITRTLVEMCNHCWCKDDPCKAEHAKCCKCADTMHVRFIPARALDTPQDDA